MQVPFKKALVQSSQDIAEAKETKGGPHLSCQGDIFPSPTHQLCHWPQALKLKK